MQAEGMSTARMAQPSGSAPAGPAARPPAQARQPRRGGRVRDSGTRLRAAAVLFQGLSLQAFTWTAMGLVGAGLPGGALGEGWLRSWWRMSPRWGVHVPGAGGASPGAAGSWAASGGEKGPQGSSGTRVSILKAHWCRGPRGLPGEGPIPLGPVPMARGLQLPLSLTPMPATSAPR